MARRNRHLMISLPSSSVGENKGEPELNPTVVKDGTKLVEELLQTWAAAAAPQNGEDGIMDDADRDATESPEVQLEALYTQEVY